VQKQHVEKGYIFVNIQQILSDKIKQAMIAAGADSHV